MTPELQNTLAALANKLGVSVEYLWPKLVGHAKVDAWTGIIFGSIGMVVVVFILKWAFKVIREDDDLFPAGVLTAIIAGIFAIVLPIMVACSISNACYPEASALHSLIPHN